MCRCFWKSASYHASYHSQIYFCPSRTKVHCAELEKSVFSEPFIRVTKVHFMGLLSCNTLVLYSVDLVSAPLPPKLDKSPRVCIIWTAPPPSDFLSTRIYIGPGLSQVRGGGINKNHPVQQYISIHLLVTSWHILSMNWASPPVQCQPNLFVPAQPLGGKLICFVKAGQNMGLKTLQYL